MYIYHHPKVIGVDYGGARAPNNLNTPMLFNQFNSVIATLSPPDIFISLRQCIRLSNNN